MAQDPGHPFAAGQIAQPPRTTAPAPAPIQTPESLIDRVRGTPAPVDRVAVRVAREEAIVQGALWGRHRDIEAILGRRVPTSAMMSGQDARDGVGSLPDAEYEAQIEALRSQHPDRLAALESRADMIARLSGRRAVTYYRTPYGDAEARTTSDGRLVLSTADGRSGPLSIFPGATPVRAADPSDVSRGDGSVAAPRVRSLGERFASTAADMANTNPLMAAGRWAASRGPAYDEFEDFDNPGQTIRYASFGQEAIDYEAERRDAYQMMAQSDAWDAGDASALHKLARGAATVGGALSGSAADPTTLIAPGRTAVGRVAGAVGANVLTDAGTQAADISTGIQDDYDPLRTVTAAALGGVIQGGVEGAGAVARAIDPNPGGVVGALASEIDAGSRVLTDSPRPRAPDPAMRAALSRIDRDRQDALRTGPADGGASQATQRALDDLRMPPRPDVEREIDDLFGGAEVRAAESATPASPTPDGAVGTTGPTPAGLEAVEHQGRRILSGSFDPRTVDADPARFQYREGAGPEGVTDALADVTSWDQSKAGQTILFEDRDGIVFAVDGHQRRGLARRLIASGEAEDARLNGRLFRAADGWAADDVRTLAAFTNLREASATVVDAAAILRKTPHLIEDRSLPISGEFVEVSRALARLSPEAFAAVEGGAAPYRLAAVVGELAADRPDLHLSMVRLVGEVQPRSLDEGRALIHEARLRDFAEEQRMTADLFGAAPKTRDLTTRAQLRTAVLQRLRRDPATFASLSRSAEAMDAGGYANPRTPGEARLAGDLVAFSLIDKLALRGADDVFGDSARAMTRGDLSIDDAARAVEDALRAGARTADALDAERAALLNPSPRSPSAEASLRAFGEPGGKGQAEQVRPKPEDAEAEARASTRYDDLPEVDEEQKALDALRVCAPGKA